MKFEYLCVRETEEHSFFFFFKNPTKEWLEVIIIIFVSSIFSFFGGCVGEGA